MNFGYAQPAIQVNLPMSYAHWWLLVATAITARQDASLIGCYEKNLTSFWVTTTTNRNNFDWISIGY